MLCEVLEKTAVPVLDVTLLSELLESDSLLRNEAQESGEGRDFAQTCGVELDISDEVVAYLRRLAQGIDPVGRENGSFKAAVTAPEDASPIDQLAAFAGRTPMHH